MKESKSDYTVAAEGAIRDMELPGGELEGLYGPVRYGMSAGGKRLRPMLCLMLCDAFCGDASRALPQATGLELFHNFTLLHDDVMDNSPLRRGRPTVHEKWDVNTAILSGDTMLTLATEQIGKCDDSLLRRVLGRFDSMALRVYEGQRLDMDFENREEVGLESYLHMVGLKTGALLGASAAIGGIVGGADDAQADLLYDFGYKLGIAFQIQDDYLDVFGDSSTFGKPIGGDINNGKRTYLLEAAYSQGGEAADALKSAMSLEPGDTKIKTVTRLYERMGISGICREAIGTFSAEALKSLKRSGVGADAYEMLRDLVSKLTGRRR